MRPALYTRFIDKAKTALIGAVEIYNKPSFQYREETFALLAINAWELLLKARLLKDGKNNPRVIRVYEQRQTRSGKATRKTYLKKNRSGNPTTISLNACINALDKSSVTRLSNEIKANIEALTAIRDNAAHYVNASTVLSRQVLEIASASVKNFVLLAKDWFNQDFSGSLSLVLPLSFLGGNQSIEAVVTSDEIRLINYLQQLASKEPEEGSPYSIAVRIQIQFERSKLSTASKVQVSNDADAIKVTFTEQDIRDRYPWDYDKLVMQLKGRYSDFKQNSKFDSLKKPLLANQKYAHSRFLDPGNPKSSKKIWYSQAVLAVFDKHYKMK